MIMQQLLETARSLEVISKTLMRCITMLRSSISMAIGGITISFVDGITKVFSMPEDLLYSACDTLLTFN